MEVPEIFRGIKKVKECVTYHDLGFTTKQIRDRKINAGLHL